MGPDGSLLTWGTLQYTRFVWEDLRSIKVSLRSLSRSWVHSVFPGGASGKEVPASARDIRDTGFSPGSGRSHGEKEMATHSSILAWEIPRTEDPGGLQSLPGEFHGQRSLVGYSLWGWKESNTTQQLSTPSPQCLVPTFIVTCISPLCSPIHFPQWAWRHLTEHKIWLQYFSCWYV